MYNKMQEGYDVVFAQRYERQDKYIKKLCSKLFYMLYSYFIGVKTDASVANFSIAKRNVIEGFKQMREQDRFYPLSIKWLGFKTGFVEVEHAWSKRDGATTSYDFSKLFNLAIDSIISYSNKPLKISIAVGFLISLFAFLYGFYLVFSYLYLGATVEGWTSILVSIYFVGGLVILNMGILGLYIGKIFDEAKKRPLYVIREKVGI
jgi:polyisoprenyl-phosphate glycosyltransferase